MARRLTLILVVGAFLILPNWVGAQELLTNPGLELVFPDEGGRDSVPPGWSMSEGPAVPANPNNPGGALLSLAEPINFAHLLLEGDWFMWFQPYFGTLADQTDNFAHLTQTVPGMPGMLYTMTGWALFEDYFPGGVVNLNAKNPNGTPTGAPFDDGPLSPTESYFALEFLDLSNSVLTGSVEIELKADGQPSNSTWTQHTLSAVAPAGTTSVRVRVSMTDGVYNPLPSPPKCSGCRSLSTLSR